MKKPIPKEQRKFIPLESCAVFSFLPLFTRIKEELRKKFPDIPTGSEEFIKLMYKTLKAFSLNDQQFDYGTQGNYLGGYRWYVLCPECGKKCFKLYLPEEESRAKLYLCKNCHSLKHTSAILGPTPRYQKVIRPLKQLENIKKLLLKKSMTPEKAKHLLDAYDRIEQQLKSASEYRLWKFQKEHKTKVKELLPPEALIQLRLDRQAESGELSK